MLDQLFKRRKYSSQEFSHQSRQRSLSCPVPSENIRNSREMATRRSALTCLEVRRIAWIWILKLRALMCYCTRSFTDRFHWRPATPCIAKLAWSFALLSRVRKLHWGGENCFWESTCYKNSLFHDSPNNMWPEWIHHKGVKSRAWIALSIASELNKYHRWSFGQFI